jgi:hypothetical protein
MLVMTARRWLFAVAGICFATWRVQQIPRSGQLLHSNVGRVAAERGMTERLIAGLISGRIGIGNTTVCLSKAMLRFFVSFLRGNDNASARASALAGGAKAQSRFLLFLHESEFWGSREFEVDFQNRFVVPAEVGWCRNGNGHKCGSASAEGFDMGSDGISHCSAWDISCNEYEISMGYPIGSDGIL